DVVTNRLPTPDPGPDRQDLMSRYLGEKSGSVNGSAGFWASVESRRGGPCADDERTGARPVRGACGVDAGREWWRAPRGTGARTGRDRCRRPPSAPAPVGPVVVGDGCPPVTVAPRAGASPVVSPPWAVRRASPHSVRDERPRSYR